MALLFVVIWQRIVLSPSRDLITRAGLFLVIDKSVKGKSTNTISNFWKFIVNTQKLFHPLLIAKIQPKVFHRLKILKYPNHQFLFFEVLQLFFVCTFSQIHSI